jgi:glycosyltransferase involved in cell wall biosynthesis
MNKKSLVSVIIPTYKRPMINRAIESVLNQTYKNIEIIVVDDNDPDSKYRNETEQVMLRYKENKNVKYIKHEKNRNGATARNTGIKNASGQYIAFLDDDDEFFPQKIELQIKKLESLDISWGGVYCGYQIYENNICISKNQNLIEGDLKRDVLLKKASICAGSTLLIKKKVIDELKGFDESFDRHQDLEFLVRFFRDYKLAVIKEILVTIHKDHRINAPNGRKDEVNKIKYLGKFKNDIELFPKKIQRQIYKRHYLETVKIFIAERNFNKAFYYYKKAKKYSRIKPMENIFIIINLINIFIPIKKNLNIIYEKLRY